MAERFEDTTGGAPSTEFERSIARGAGMDGSPSKVATEASPLVDGNGNALKRDDPNAAGDQLKALRTELENLRQSVATIVTTGRRMATEKVDVTVTDLEETFKRNVFASIGIAAFVGYLWGRTR